MNAKSRIQLLNILDAVRANPDLYEYIGLNDSDIKRLQKEVKEDKEMVNFT